MLHSVELVAAVALAHFLKIYALASSCILHTCALTLHCFYVFVDCISYPLYSRSRATFFASPAAYLTALPLRCIDIYLGVLVFSSSCMLLRYFYSTFSVQLKLTFDRPRLYIYSSDDVMITANICQFTYDPGTFHKYRRIKIKISENATE